MTEDQTRQRKVNTLEQWAEAKTRRAVLDTVFDTWRDLFTRAAIQLESLTGPVNADLKSLPPGPDVDAAVREYKMLADQLQVYKDQLTKMGLKLE